MDDARAAVKQLIGYVGAPVPGPMALEVVRFQERWIGLDAADATLRGWALERAPRHGPLWFLALRLAERKTLRHCERHVVVRSAAPAALAPADVAVVMQALATGLASLPSWPAATLVPARAAARLLPMVGVSLTPPSPPLPHASQAGAGSGATAAAAAGAEDGGGDLALYTLVHDGDTSGLAHGYCPGRIVSTAPQAAAPPENLTPERRHHALSAFAASAAAGVSACRQAVPDMAPLEAAAELARKNIPREGEWRVSVEAGHALGRAATAVSRLWQDVCRAKACAGVLLLGCKDAPAAVTAALEAVRREAAAAQTVCANAATHIVARCQASFAAAEKECPDAQVGCK
jgi:hypothetical protein